MDLKEFIVATISAITDATSELQSKYEPNDVIINPPASQTQENVFEISDSSYTKRRVQAIEFDVAVTAASETSGGGKAGIKVLSFELGADGGRSVVAEQVSRVHFSIPMTLRPSEHEGKHAELRTQEEAARQKAVDEQHARMRRSHP